MAIRINFDSQHVPEKPTLVLAKRNGEKLGAIPAYNIVFKDALNEASEISFTTINSTMVLHMIYGMRF